MSVQALGRGSSCVYSIKAAGITFMAICTSAEAVQIEGALNVRLKEIPQEQSDALFSAFMDKWYLDNPRRVNPGCKEVWDQAMKVRKED